MTTAFVIGGNLGYGVDMALLHMPGVAPSGAARAAACLLALAALALPGRVPGAPAPGLAALPGDTDADRLTAVVDSLQDHWHYVEALVAETRQLELRARDLGVDAPRTLESWIRMGRLLHWSGNYARADVVLRTGLALARERLSPDDPVLAGFHHAIGLVLKDRGRKDEALVEYETAERILLRSGDADALPLAPIYRSMASIHRLQGRFDEAERLRRRSLDILRQHYGEESVEVAEARTWLGWFLLNRRRYDEAEHELQAALACLRRLQGPRSPDLRETLGFLAQIRLARGDRAGADSVYALQSSQPRVHFEPMSLSYGLRVGMAGDLRPGIMLAQGDLEGLWDEVESANGMVSRRFVRLAGLERHSPHAPELHACRNAVLDGERAVAAWARSRDTDAPAPGLVLDLLVADARRMALEQEMLADAGPDRGLSAAEIQQELRPGEAILGFQIAPIAKTSNTSVYAYLLRDRGPVRWVDLGMMNRTAYRRWYRPIFDLKQVLERDAAWPERLPRSPQVDDLARQGWDRLIQPVADGLNGVGSLIIAGWPPPIQVPVEALRDPEGRDLIDRFTVSYAPSASVFAMLRARHRDPPPSPHGLLIGAPVFNGTPVADRQEEKPAVAPSYLQATLVRSLLDGDAGARERLPRLPLAEAELTSVAETLPGSTRLLGEAASEEKIESIRLAGGLKDFDVIHVATHALLDGGRAPERSALVLSHPVSSGTAALDGLISAEEIYLGWDLNADLVTLSACQTATGERGKAGEYIGFLQALLRAGARSLLCSQWKVDDTATRMLMDRFYHNLYGGAATGGGGPRVSKREALARAQRWLRDYRAPDGTTPFGHPVYWAGFVLIGDPD